MTTTHTTSVPRHSGLTRLAHGALALAIITQLASSQFMIPEEPGKVANSAFEVHEYGGLAAFAFMLVFWLALTTRQFGTAPATLFPWFSGDRLSALWADTKSHAASIMRLKVPPYEPASALAGAIHGLGLIIATLMAASGTLYYFVNAGDPDGGGLVALAMNVHRTFGNLAWAYLILHATTGVIYHYASDMSLRDMWSVRGHSQKG
ncbi:MAG: cytochrome b/b6 domain-containing protein [Pseudomonadota bacterium]|nr:cytochrome b/b6 domain-containing protein [Pseudomonadota bacterium]MEE3070513.1 cytochrome b/b6 domain-containing protein [Pseudomonadota bacterium]